MIIVVLGGGAWCWEEGPGAGRRGLVLGGGAWCREEGPGADWSLVLGEGEGRRWSH